MGIHELLFLIMCNVAFIMSVYQGDRADWLRAALDSMLNQNIFQDHIHIYVCADGPLTPELEDCLSFFTGSIHRLIRNETNLGLAVSLNRLIDALEDESFVFRMDADDICLPDRADLQIKFMELHPEIMLCGGSIQEFRNDPENKGLLRTYPDSTPAMRSYIVKANPFAHSTVCFRRDFFTLVGKYNDHLPLRQDIELWFRAVEQHIPMSNLREPVLLFRVSDDLVRRRNLAVGMVEFRIFMRGIYRLYGIHPAMIWPLLRLAVRILPAWATGVIYRRNARKWLNS
jgi:glycosyltransferase involved in cell wall biosynthesis